MAKLTRTEKYKDLRESLAHDVGQEIESRDLERFQSRLNQLDSANFEAPRQSTGKASDHDPIHARRTEAMHQSEAGSTPDLNFDLSHDRYQDLYQTDSFSNDYLDRYINEVKQYNIEQGNAVSENTSVNILNRLHQDQGRNAPSRPFRSEKKEESSVRRSQTAEVPFIGSQQSSSASARDIASQVQNLADEDQDDVQEIPDVQQEQPRRKSRMDTDEFSRHLELERTTRQQLLNETTQMRAKLDDYEDNLSEVSDKMRHTNQILNIVLIVLIVALVIVLAVVIYWIVLSNGGR